MNSDIEDILEHILKMLINYCDWDLLTLRAIYIHTLST